MALGDESAEGIIFERPDAGVGILDAASVADLIVSILDPGSGGSGNLGYPFACVIFISDGAAHRVADENRPTLHID